jgi:hypothetical protein
MGPSIILDKSAVEAIGNRALHVQSEFFYTVVTPILVWEVCGDIQKSREGKCDASKVRALAKKAKPLSSIVTTDWRKLCIGELSGYRFEMGTGPARRAIVDGAHQVPLDGGGYGVVIDQQPEADALLRWYAGRWTDADTKYAEEWRRVTKAIDLDAFKRRFGPARQPIGSNDELKDIVTKVLADPSLQYFLITLLAEEVTASKETRRQLLRRWRGTRSTAWQANAPYCRHCLRTFLTFYLALGSGLVGTKATNRVDVEYLLYLPFAPIFVSGDEGTHGRLAPLLIGDDQLFVRSAEFRAALQEHADRVDRLREGDAEPDPDLLEPEEGSLIRELWIKAWGKFRPRPSERPQRDEGAAPRVGNIAEEFKKAMDHVDAHPEQYKKRPPWPNL